MSTRKSRTRRHSTKRPRPPALRLFLGKDEIIVDNFAGGGGASTGATDALGRAPDIAINHDPEAIAMHRANHPTTQHYETDVWEVDPVEACDGRPVALAWFSPDCKHHSKAKGGKPRDQKIRGLAWVAVRWAAAVKPRVIALENVEEFLQWGRLDKHGIPVPERKGETFRAFVRKLEALGYVVEWRLLRACDYGAPTTRRRLFLVARCDGRPICWPAPTHGPGLTEEHKPAADVIDWSVACPSIFERERPLADKTMARIARGIRKFVLDNPRPFIIPVNHGGIGRKDLRVHDSGDPLPTITGGSRGGHAVVSPLFAKAKTYSGGGNDAKSGADPLGTILASKRGEHAIILPYLVHRSNGERVGQAPRIYDIERPVGTIVAQGQKQALCAALLVKHNGGKRNDKATLGDPIDKPIGTVTARDHHSLVAMSLTKMYGTSTGSDVRDPVPTVTANGKGGGHLAAVSAFLVRYNGASEAQPLTKPAGTLTTKDRYALITVKIDGETYVLVDIGMRMLTPRELYRAQGFPESYRVEDVVHEGKLLTKTAQIRMCGNSVCPPLAAAVVRAQFQEAA